MIPLHVTSGEIELAITNPSVRAILGETEGHEYAILRFRYDGPTKEKEPLGSGEIRHQMGIKLHAFDGNNVVYAMWRFDPDEPTDKGYIQVQVKCNGSYFGPEEVYFEVKDIAPEIGKIYRMKAKTNEEVVRVWLNDRPVWAGALNYDVMNDVIVRAGNIGLRTDNVMLGDISLS